MERNKKVQTIHRKQKTKLTETVSEEAQILNIVDNKINCPKQSQRDSGNQKKNDSRKKENQ